MSDTGPGIIFDQHYTDSLLKIAHSTKNASRSLITTKRSLPRKDVLVSLLLFGQAHIAKPAYYRDSGWPELARLIDEELIRWIPETAEYAAFTHLVQFFDSIEKIVDLDYNIDIPYDSVRDGITFEDYGYYKQRYLEQWMDKSDAMFDAFLLARNIMYLEPVMHSNLNHFLVPVQAGPVHINPLSPLLPLISGFFRKDPVYPYDDVFEISVKVKMARFLSFVEKLITNPDILPYGFYEFADYQLEELEQGELRTNLDLLREMSKVLFAAFSCGTIENYASNTGIAIKSASRPLYAARRQIISNEEYVLVQAQFESLGYPVVESIDDVLRLRDHKGLRSYRKVIMEYAQQLRSEFEGGRQKVLQDFERDLKLSVKDLERLSTYKKFENFVFYFSIPLATLGLVVGAPLTDLLLIPATAVSKIVQAHKRKKLDWLLVGRPEE